ncbi:MAG: GldM family protein, partial [Bacteroidota bacterium]
YDQINTIMLGPGESKSGKGYELKDELNKYVKDLKAILPKIDKKGVDPDSLKNVLNEFDPLALDGDQDKRYKDDPEQNGKDWAFLSFDHTPMVAALAVLNEIKTEVRNVEAKAIEALGSQLGLVDIKFDQIIGRVSPESRVVAAGTKYKAEMFIAASSSNIVPVMKSSLGPVKFDKEKGVGVLESGAQSPAPGGPGKSQERTWKGSIYIPSADTTITFEEKFTVVNPQIKIKSDVAVSLYFKCGNTLNVDVPELGATYDPTFTGTGGQIIKGAGKGDVTLVPNAKQMTLTVSSGGNKIGTEGPFRVSLVPKPEIKVLVGSKPANQLQGESKSRLRSVKVVPVADDQFKKLLPKDARYRITGGQVTLARGKRALGQVKISGGTVNLTSLIGNAQEGDRLVFEINGVQRMNFQNQVENVNVGTQIITVPVNN